MNKITEKWRPTGLLEDLEDETQCDDLALALDNMAHRLLKDVPPYTPDGRRFAGMILRIVRRLYEDIHPALPTEWLHNDFKQFYTDKKQLREDLWDAAYIKLDSECEFMTLYTDDVVSRFEKEFVETYLKNRQSE